MEITTVFSIRYWIRIPYTTDSSVDILIDLKNNHNLEYSFRVRYPHSREWTNIPSPNVDSKYHKKGKPLGYLIILSVRINDLKA